MILQQPFNPELLPRDIFIEDTQPGTMKNIYYRTRNKVRHTNKIVRKNGKHILDKNKTIREGLKEKKKIVEFSN